MKKSFAWFLVFAFLIATPASAQQIYPFYTGAGGGTSLAVTATAAPSTAVALSGSPQVMVTNTGAQTGFVAFGSSSIAATTTSTPIPAGAIEVFSLDPTMGYASALTVTSTTQLYFTSGRGN